jgi:outer membrane protein assembly factor BamB
MHSRLRILIVLTFALLLLPFSMRLRAAAVTDLLDQLGTDRGICVVISNNDASLALDLAAKSELLVYTTLPDAAQVAEARAAAEAAGLGRDRFQVDIRSSDRLGLGSNLVDAAIVMDPSNPANRAEIMRVLKPKGKAIFRDQVVVKPTPEGVDDWTHYYYGPDNNPLSQDSQIKAPYLTQFLADPPYGSAPQVTVAAAGRVFKIFGNIAWHEREETYLNVIVAYDGYNGTILWKYQLPADMMIQRSVFVATPEVLYVGDDQSCKLIDTKTGQVKDQIRPDVDIAGGTFWKWMALQDGVLYALIGEQELRDSPTRWKRTEHGWPWNAISRGFNRDEQPWGYGRNVLAIDVRTKEILWSYRENEPIDSRAICMNADQLFAFRFGSYLTCLDTKTGQPLWRKAKDDSPELFDSLGEYLPRQSWQTNWRTTAFLKCSPDALYFAGPQIGKLLAVSTQDGRILWEDPYDNYQLIIRDDVLYGFSGPWGNNASKKFDPLSGKVLGELPTGRRACTRPVGTLDSVFFRAMGGSVRFNCASDKPEWISPMRPGCHDGVTVANGLLYWWPYVCDCQLTLYGVTCLGSAGEFNFRPDWKDADRLAAAAESNDVQPCPIEPADWPTFRGNSQATALSRSSVPRTARLLWQTKLSQSVDIRPTAPVAVGDLVFVAGSDGATRCLEATQGEAKWTAYTGAEIRLPPTIWDGRALVGSGDGHVYSYEAATGRELWRLRAAPQERKIPVYGQLLSTWPVSTGVLIQDDTAYFGAGIANYDGTYIYAVDPATGYVKWCNDTSGHLDPIARTGVSVQGHLLTHADKLYLAGGNAVSPAIYDLRDGQCLNDPAPLARCESTSPRGWELFLVGDRVIACGRPFYGRPGVPVYDPTVTNKMFHASTGKRDIVWLNNQAIACFDPLDKDELSRCVSDEKIPRHITQTWGKFQTSQHPYWKRDCPDSLAIAVAENAVVLADTQKVIALDLITGGLLWEQALPAAPVPWGLALNRHGNALVTLTDGHVVCIGD